jgi:hypothetical protein
MRTSHLAATAATVLSRQCKPPPWLAPEEAQWAAQAPGPEHLQLPLSLPRCAHCSASQCPSLSGCAARHGALLRIRGVIAALRRSHRGRARPQGRHTSSASREWQLSRGVEALLLQLCLRCGRERYNSEIQGAALDLHVFSFLEDSESLGDG